MWGSLCLLLVIEMLILVLSPAWLRVFLLVGLLILASSVGVAAGPGMTCKFKLDECAGSRRDLVVACPNALAASSACRSHVFKSGLQRYQPVWPACWVDTPDRSASSASKVVQDIWDIFREELGLFLLILYWLSGRLLIRIVLMSSGMSGELVVRLVFFDLISERVFF